MNHLKTETTMRDMIKKGSFHDAKNIGERYLKENGGNVTIQHLMASIYFALNDVITAWFYIHRNPESELKAKIFSRIRWLYPNR